MAFKKIPLTIDTMIRNPVPIEGINQEDNIELNIVVTENKTPKDLSRQTIKVYVRRIDGTLVEQTDQITPTNASKGEITVKLKNSAFNKEGYALFQLDVSDSSGRITSSYATFKIGKELVSGEAIANTNEIEALKKVEEYIKKANQELETFKQTVAEINENEATRQENEVVRVREEASRNEAEAIRVQQEATRKEKENERVQAEIQRIADEEVRRENEALRGSKELERKQAEELRKEKELLRIADENNRKVAESKRIEAESSRVETEKLRVDVETGRVEAENLRTTAEEKRVAAETKREEEFNKFEGRISANTEELKNARSATTGEKFNTLDERIDHEVDRLNKKIDITMLQQEDKEIHAIENTVEGMTTDMVIKGSTLQNLLKDKIDFISSSSSPHTGQKKLVFATSNSKPFTIIADIKYTGSSSTQLFVRGNKTDSTFVEFGSINVPSNFNGRIACICNQNIDKGCSSVLIGFRVNSDNSTIKNVIILEGDWNNKLFPQYFEGIKSFGQQEDKISILSSGKNLLNFKSFENYIKNTHENEVLYSIKLKPNTNYTFSDKTGEWNGKGAFLILKDKDKKEVSRLIDSNVGNRKSISFTTNNNTNYYLFTYKNNIDKFNSISSNYQIEEGTQPSPYEPYQSDKKDILLQNLGFDEGLRGINSISDELNSIRNVAIKRIGKREYRDGDLLLDNVITDKVNTYYVLEEPIETPLDENINLKTFGEKTYVSFENAINGTSSFKVPVNTVATISSLNRENRALEEENKNLRQDFESTTLSLADRDLELVKQNVDMDFRLMEVEFALDIPQSTLSSNINFKK
ncbi:hypothetical protein [Clostridium phage XP41-N3]|nr:hypothetical protein [Clostridium phage XP41-N3]